MTRPRRTRRHARRHRGGAGGHRAVIVAILVVRASYRRPMVLEAPSDEVFEERESVCRGSAFGCGDCPGPIEASPDDGKRGIRGVHLGARPRTGPREAARRGPGDARGATPGSGPGGSRGGAARGRLPAGARMRGPARPARDDPCASTVHPAPRHRPSPAEGGCGGGRGYRLASQTAGWPAPRRRVPTAFPQTTSGSRTVSPVAADRSAASTISTRHGRPRRSPPARDRRGSRR